jgi:glycosyltransferase involved in cell wall biosynthesis
VTFTAVDPPQIEDALKAPFDRDSTLAALGIPATDFVVLCVGQFIDRKGRWVFLDAAREIVQTRRDISFVWLTPQLPNDDDEQRITDYKLGDKFKLVLSETLGKDRIDVLRFFRIADVFTLPSFVEGLPIALLEGNGTRAAVDLDECLRDTRGDKGSANRNFGRSRRFEGFGGCDRVAEG